MGFIIEIDTMVSVELRVESFTLRVGNQFTEYEYEYADAIKAALFQVEKSERYLDHVGPKLLKRKRQ